MSVGADCLILFHNNPDFKYTVGNLSTGCTWLFIHFNYFLFSFSARDMSAGIAEKWASANINIVVDAIVDAVTLLNPKIRYVLGWDANLIWIWISRFPTGVGDALMRFFSKFEAPAQHH